MRGIRGFLILGVGLAGACGPAPATPSPTATPMPAPTATPTMMPTPTAAPTPMPTPTPVPPPAPSPTPTSPVGTPCPAPAIPVTPGAVRAAEGCLSVHLEAGQVWEKDGFELAAAVGYTGPQPPCAAFALALSWQTTAGDGSGLLWTMIRLGEEHTVAQGPSGAFQPGCGFLRLHHNGPGPVDVAVRVAVDLVGWTPTP